MLERLAALYATLKGTKVIATQVTNDRITFVVEAGGKFTMSEDELKEQIEKLTPRKEAGSDGAGVPAPLLKAAAPPAKTKTRNKKGA